MTSTVIASRQQGRHGDLVAHGSFTNASRLLRDRAARNDASTVIARGRASATWRFRSARKLYERFEIASPLATSNNN
jgi:hypothetical protein